MGSSEQPENKNPVPEQLAPFAFKPGQSGNPGGRPKKRPISDLYEEILGDQEAISMLRKSIMKALKGGNMAMVLQLKEMAERVEGKVSQGIEVEGSLAIQTISERMQKARERASGK